MIALESAELEERQESSVDISWDDIRNAVVAECPEYQFEAAAAFGTCRSQPEKLEAGQGRQSCCIGPGCWCHGYGFVRHGWREDREPLVILGKSGYHVKVHCVLLLTASWWVS